LGASIFAGPYDKVGSYFAWANAMVSDSDWLRNLPKFSGEANPASFGPVGFHWLLPGLLGGVAQPGLMRDAHKDLEALQYVGTKLLVTLTREWVPDRAAIDEYGMQSLYFPIDDFAAPKIAPTIEVCKKVEAFTQRGEAVVFHCHAGKGRTGTLLATQLVWAGATAQQAITYTRKNNSLWIETPIQIKFLSEFAQILPSIR